MKTNNLRFGGILAVIFLNFLLTFQAAAERYWQLTLGYTPKQLYLLRAGQMPSMSKAIRTPGINGAVLQLDYEIDWLDENGLVLLTTPAVIPLGGHSVQAEPGIDGSLDLALPGESAFVLRIPGPENAALAKQVRLRKKLAVGFTTVAPGPPVPPAFIPEEQTFVLPAIAPAAAPGPISATKVRNTGQDGNRFVIAIMGDGFTAADLATGSFANKVSAFQTALFGTSPWNSYSSMVNVYRVDIESAESGADYANAAPEAGGTLKDTYLNAGFWVGGTDRCLFLRGSGVARAMAAADDLVGVGVWDEILVFVNSTTYGGCGGAVGVSSINSSSDEIQIHEFGHSFAGLADEYEYGSASTNCTPSSTRNIDCPNNFPLVKWQVWLTPGTPIPTPATAQYSGSVGAFEGANTQASGVYRPMQNCKMRTLGTALCPICKEAHVLKLFQNFRIADLADPPLGTADVPAYGSRLFRITPINVTGLTYQWFTNGVAVPNATSTSFLVTGSQIVDTNFTVSLQATHSTPLVRAETIVQTNVWKVRSLPEPALSVGNATVVEGNSGFTNLVFPVILSYAHTSQVEVSYATVNGTATAGSDYLATNGVLVFSPGQTTNFIQVTVQGDPQTEADEILFVSLANPVHATIQRVQGVGLILDRDQPPGIAISAPAPASTFSAPANITVSADAFDVDGFVTRVEFFSDSTKLGEVTQQPFSLTWSNVAAGNYTLTLIATDNSGKQSTSAPVNISVLTGVAQNFVLLTLTNLWRYDASTNDFGTAWKEPGYNDAAWAGPARALLHNEPDSVPGPKNTQIPLTYNGDRIHGFYFRAHFNFPTNPGPGFILTSTSLIDDGAVFWLNGSEVARIRMPAGAIVRTNFASATPTSGDATNFDVIVLSATNLLAGDNVMAVEVHQQSATSSDVVFGMALEALQGFAPIITDPNQPANRTVVQGRSSVLSVSAAASPAATYLWYRNGTLLSASSNPNYTIANMSAALAGSYLVRITNVVGAVTSRVAVVTYQSDSTAPELLYALASTNLTRVTVSFSEALNATDAATAGNYKISGGGSNLVVTAATLQGTNVILTTAARAPGVNYVLTVNNIRDVVGNTIPANSSIPIATELVVVAADGSIWNYFQSDRDPGLGWAVMGFQVSSDWGNGPALLDAKRPAGRSTVGPNNEPVRTMLNMTNPPGASDETITYYFRTTFNLPGPAAGARLHLRTLVDDGAVFYLNGVELYRLRMPAWPASIGYSDFATVSRGDTENVYEGPFDVPASALRDGQNVLAAEVHQANNTSSDITFGAQLIAEVPMLGFAPLNLTITPSTNGFYLNWSRAGAILEEASAVQGPFAPVSPQAASPYLVAPAAGAKFYRLHLPE